MVASPAVILPPLRLHSPHDPDEALWTLRPQATDAGGEGRKGRLPCQHPWSVLSLWKFATVVDYYMEARRGHLLLPWIFLCFSPFGKYILQISSL